MNKGTVKKINIIYFISFFADALVSPFLALFFLSVGITGVKQGILLCLIPFSNLLGNLLYGKLSFNLKRNLKITSALCLVECIILSFFGFLSNYTFLIIFTIIFAFHNSPFFSFSDGIACKYCENEEKPYAITRMFGSIGYLVAVSIGGLLIDTIDYKYTFLISSLLFAIISIVILFLKPVESNQKEENKISYKEVFTNKTFILYLVFYVLAIGGWQVGEAYLSTYFHSQGLSTTIWGYCYASQIVFEVITMLLTQKFLKEDKYPLFLYINVLIMAIRNLIIFMPIPMYPLLFIEIPLRGIAWGLFLCLHMNLLKRICNVDLITKCVTALAVIVGVFATIMEYFVPYIFSDYSYLYACVSCLQFASLLILVCIKFDVNKKEEKKVEVAKDE